jgi:hypothetical protein
MQKEQWKEAEANALEAIKLGDNNPGQNPQKYSSKINERFVGDCWGHILSHA